MSVRPRNGTLGEREKTVGFGLVGLGNIAARVAASAAAADGARVAAVQSRDSRKAEAFARRHGVPAAYTDFQHLVEDPGVDVVYLATPNAYHAEQAIAALDAGKHVLVEKPMALNVSEAQAMATAAQARGRTLGVGFHLRFHPVHIEIRRKVTDGEIGTPVYAEGLFGSVADIAKHAWQLDPVLAGHGSLTGLGVHLIDLLPWMLGRRILEVVAMSDGPGDRRPVESFTTTLARFDGGVHGVLTSSRRLPNACNSVRIYGSNGLVEGYRTIGVTPSGTLRETHDGDTTEQAPSLVDLYQIELEQFARAVARNEPFAVSAQDGVASVAVTSAIAEAAATGRAVTL